MTHVEPHLREGLCQCTCAKCVDDWREMKFGGARRHCTCSDCDGGECPNWRLDREMYDRVRGVA